MAKRTNAYRGAQDERTHNNALREIEVTAKPIVIAKETVTEEQNISETTPTFEDLESKRNYKFPLTLEQEGFPAKIIFRAKKIEGVNALEAAGLTKLTESIFNNLEKTSIAEEGLSAQESNRIISDSNIKRKETLSYENNTGGTPYGSVTLPLQIALRYNDVVTYSSQSLGVIGGSAEGAMTGQNPFAGATKGDGSLATGASALVAQTIAKNVGSIVGAAAGLGFGGKLVGAGLGAVAGSNVGEGLGNAVKSATRVASAPNLRTLFDNVPIREFSFDFELVANSEEESKAIKDIIKFFRQELYPEKIPLGTSGIPLAYKFPNVFEIEVQNRYGQNPEFKIQRCYLRSVITSFNEVARGMFVDGNFVSANISVAFTEIVALDKQKIRAGY